MHLVKLVEAFAVTTEIVVSSYKITQRLELDNSQFRASLSWCLRFLHRHGLSVWKRTTLTQSLLRQNGNKIIEFHRFII